MIVTTDSTAAVDEVTARRARRSEAGHPSGDRRVARAGSALPVASVLRAWRSAVDVQPGRPPELVFADGHALVSLVLQAVAGEVAPMSDRPPLMDPGSRATGELLVLAVSQLARLRDVIPLDDQADGCETADEEDAAVAREGRRARLNRCIDTLCVEVVAELTGQLEAAALVDGPTDLPNRRAFHRDLPGELAATDRYQRVITLIAVQQVDAQPPGGGGTDPATSRLAHCLAAAVRTGDRVYRVGDHRFAVVLRDASQHAADRVVCRAIGRGAPPFVWGASCTLRDGHHADPLWDAAERRLDEHRRNRGRRGGG